MSTFKTVGAAMLAVLALTAPASAENICPNDEFRLVGVRAGITNDTFVPGTALNRGPGGAGVSDRYETGSGKLSLAACWQKVLWIASAEGQLYAPRSLRKQPIDDPTLYTGYVTRTFGGAFELGSYEVYVAAGVDIVDSEAGARIQTGIHDLFGFEKTPQLDRLLVTPDQTHFTLKGEVSRAFALSDNWQVRPHVRASFGFQDTLALGIDVTGNASGRVAGWNPVTHEGDVYGRSQGWFTSFGVSAVFQLDTPQYGAADVYDVYGIARTSAGYVFGSGVEVSAGVTYTTERFRGQYGGQFQGSVSVAYHF